MWKIALADSSPEDGFAQSRQGHSPAQNCGMAGATSYEPGPVYTTITWQALEDEAAPSDSAAKIGVLTHLPGTAERGATAGIIVNKAGRSIVHVSS